MRAHTIALAVSASVLALSACGDSTEGQGPAPGPNDYVNAYDIETRYVRAEDLCEHEMPQGVICMHSGCYDIHCNDYGRIYDPETCGTAPDGSLWPTCPGDILWWCDEEPPQILPMWAYGCTSPFGPAWSNEWLAPWFAETYPGVVVPDIVDGIIPE